MFEFIFLGTSAGVPTLQRNVSALVLKYQNRKPWCLIDCGEGTQHQLLRTSHSLVNLSAILVTHVHGDHSYGLPGLIASAAIAGRRQPLRIVAPPEIEDFVRHTMHCTDMHITYDLGFEHLEAGRNYDLEGDFSVRTHALSHRVPSFAFEFNEAITADRLDTDKLKQAAIPQGPLWGKLARREDVVLGDGRRLRACDYILPPRRAAKAVIAGDNDTPGLLSEAVAGADVLIHEATYTQAVSDHVGPGPQHSSAAQVAEFAARTAVPNLVLTHFSARYHHPAQNKAHSIADLAAEARAHYSGSLFLANDLDHFVLRQDGSLTTDGGRP